MTDQELWHELEEFPDYAVSNLGVVGNMKSGMTRKPSINQQGIVKMSLYKNGKELHTRSVAVLVAEAFVEGQTDLFNTPIHLDGDKMNCRADNLMWRPRWFAVQYHKQFFESAFRHAEVPLIELDSHQTYPNVMQACMANGLLHGDVYRSFTQGYPVPFTLQEFRILE